ncbi:MAG: hypothetical protein GXP42_19225 [Chloroflexi bacterium]|nr:hypothetical protein [Chloroflexota bacterium]
MSVQTSQSGISIGDIVEHPVYGRGRLAAIYRNGTEWMVQFDMGLRFRRPRNEFVGQEEQIRPRPRPAARPARAPMSPNRFQARQLLESLRVGVAPAQHVRELTIGLADERASLQAGLNEAHGMGGAVRAVLGEYGYGKTHIIELCAQDALERNFLVAMTSLDLFELPPHRSFNIYAGLMRNVRYPDTDERGLGPLFERAAALSRMVEHMRELGGVENDPLVVALQALRNTPSARQRKAWLQWLMGGRRVKLMRPATPRGIRFPSIYRVGHNARQMAYLLSGISVLARLNGYSGLCVLLDEAESYSLLRPYQRPKASLFFSAVIYAALQDRQSRIREEDFPQHRWRDYPLAYHDRQALFFLFTVTHSDLRMPLDEWLAEEQILELDPYHTPQEIGQFMARVMGYHAQAYGYDIGERQRQIRRGGAEILALGMRNHRLSIRRLVRLTVELFDLLYLHPDYDPAALLDELRRQVAV